VTAHAWENTKHAQSSSEYVNKLRLKVQNVSFIFCCNVSTTSGQILTRIYSSTRFNSVISLFSKH